MHTKIVATTSEHEEKSEDKEATVDCKIVEEVGSGSG